MKITKVNVIAVADDTQPSLRAYVTVVLDDSFVVKSIRLIKGQVGLFVSMPSKKFKDGSHQNLAHPINRETRRMFEEAILNEYNKITQQKREVI